MKKIIAIILAVLISIPTMCIPVYADSNDRGRAMVNYFKNDDIEGMENITDEEFRLFAVYISNFYTPFITDTSTLSACVESAVVKVKGYNDTSKMSENDTALVKQMGSAIISNMLEKSEPLKVNGSDLKLSQLFDSNDINMTYNGNTLFSMSLRSDIWGANDASSDSKAIGDLDDLIMALCVYKAATSGDNVNSWLENIYSSDNKDCTFYVSPFGDIIAKTPDSEGGGVSKAIIVVPACLNSFVFKNGLPVANNFMLSFLNTAKNTDKKLGYFDDNKDAEFDFSVISAENGNQASVYSDGYGIISFGELTRFCDEFPLDEGKLVIPKICNEDKHTHEMRKGEHMIMTWGTSVLDNILGGSSYINDSSGIGGKAVLSNDARRRIGNLFYYSRVELSKLNTNLTFFSSENEPLTINIVDNKDNKYNTLYIYEGDEEGITKGIHGYNVVLNGADGNTEIIQDGLDSIVTLNYTSKKIRDFILAIKASSSDATPWAEMFYTYMLSVDTQNSILPACDKSLITSLGNVLSEEGVNSKGDPDKVFKEKADRLLDRMLAITSDSTNQTKGNFITNCINSFILTQHRKMVGIVDDKNTTAVSNDTLAYTGFTGHVTTPRLRDVEFTANLLENYRSIYFTLLATLLIFTIIMVMLHMRTILQAIATFIVMALVLVLPQNAIDLTIQASNTVNEQLYNNRFNYWAILQHQQALSSGGMSTPSKEEDTEEGSEDKPSQEEIDSAIANTTTNMSSFFEDTGVRLKWMAPKKHDDAAELLSKSSDELTVGASTFKWLFGNYLSGESYAADNMATYCYRTYTSLAKEADNMWKNKVEGNAITGETSGLLGYAKNYKYINNLKGLSGTSDGEDGQAIFTESADINGTYQKVNYKTSFKDSARISCLYNGSEQLFTSAVTGVLENPDDYKVAYNSGVSDCFGRDDALYCYALYSESPFYYFYNTLMSIEVTDETEAGVGTSNGSTTFLTTLLADSPYKVIEGNATGYYKDFLDIESLFTYVVPYLQAANEYVIRWTDLYGLDVDTLQIGTTREEKLKILQSAWNCYSPWVDSLYSEDIYSGKIKSGGKSYYITNAFSPYAYEGEGYRPMVFGEADMYAQGVGYNDLSEVERKVQQVLEKTYEDIRYLANYSNFSDETLCTAAAMIATFNFNSIFSQNKIAGKTITLYPQGYEMKNFSYDAFLRLILLNSTGQSPSSEVDIYTSIVKNSGFWCGIFLVLTDLVAIYALPTMKFIFVLCAFVLSIVMCIGVYLQKLDQVPKVIAKALLVPMLSYFGVSFGHAFFTSLLMGEGLTDYVGSKNGALVTNEPTITLILLFVINGFASVILFNMLRKLIKTLIEWLGDTITAMTGVLTALGGAIASKVSELANTGRITFQGATATSSGGNGGMFGGFKNNAPSGVGYRTSSTTPRVASAGNNSPMPANLSRKLNSLGDKLYNMTSFNGMTKGVGKVANGVGKTAKVVGKTAGVAARKAVEVGKSAGKVASKVASGAGVAAKKAAEVGKNVGKNIGTASNKAAVVGKAVAEAVYYKSGLNEVVDKHRYDNLVSKQNKLAVKTEKKLLKAHNKYANKLGKNTKSVWNAYNKQKTSESDGLKQEYLSALHNFNDCSEELYRAGLCDDVEAVKSLTEQKAVYERQMLDARKAIARNANGDDVLEKRAAFSLLRAIDIEERNKERIKESDANITSDMRDLNNKFRDNREELLAHQASVAAHIDENNIVITYVKDASEKMSNRFKGTKLASGVRKLYNSGKDIKSSMTSAIKVAGVKSDDANVKAAKVKEVRDTYKDNIGKLDMNRETEVNKINSDAQRKGIIDVD